jgi:hypothetical protein
MSTITTWLEGRTQTVSADDPRLAEGDGVNEDHFEWYEIERASRLRHLANLFGMESPIERRAYLADLDYKDGKAPTDRLREIFRAEWERRNG